MSGDSSSSTFHDFQEFIISNYQKSGILNFKNSKNRHFMIFMNSSLPISKNPGFIISSQQTSRNSELQKFKKWTAKFPEFRTFRFFSQISIDNIFPGMFPDFSCIFPSKFMRNTGFQGPLRVKKIENVESSQNHPKSNGIGQESNFSHFGIIKTP